MAGITINSNVVGYRMADRLSLRNQATLSVIGAVAGIATVSDNSRVSMVGEGILKTGGGMAGSTIHIGNDVTFVLT